jgi:glycosyltransferase involved in cell wall biosynthesis
MKLVIATPLYPPDIGGPATYAKTLEEELRKRDIAVSVVSFHAVRHLPKGLSHLVYTVKLFRALYGADMLLALDPVSVGFPAALMALVRNKKFVVKIVGDYAWEQGRQRFGVKDNLDEFVKKPSNKFLAQVVFLRVIQNFVASRADRIIVPSNYLKEIVSLWGIDPDKIEVVYNAFDGIPELGTRAQVRTALSITGMNMLSAGRLVPWKGFHTLISLMPQLRKSFPEMKLFIAGSGPLEGELKAQIQDSGLVDAVVLLGDVEHKKLMEYIRATDCFVLNTGYEGLSHQLLEVLAVGTPIVTTNVGGNPELIEDGVTGKLVDYDDSNALTTAIIDVLSDPVRAQKIADDGKVFVSRFTVPRMVEGTLGVLTKVIERV